MSTSISTAVGSERVSRAVGYKLQGGSFNNDTPNLPMQIAILGEGNTANQATMPTTPTEVVSAAEAGQLFGFGSPIHRMVSILRPLSGDGVGGIPTIVYPQSKVSGAAAKVMKWTVSGAATKNATHTAVIAGRESIDFAPYSFTVNTGDTASDVAAKIISAINGVLGAPVTAALDPADEDEETIIVTSKWEGLTANDVKMTFNNNGDAAGITYALTSTTAGAGTPSIASALTAFGDDWNTLVVNPYTVSSVLNDLEAFNGVPFAGQPTGRYSPMVFKPFLAFCGVTSELRADYLAITSTRGAQVTNVVCPAPGSDALPMEAAANVIAIYARIGQDTPEVSPSARYYPDMPIPSDYIIGDMADYNNRDLLVKAGCSTVTLEKGAYKIQDLVTTYHNDTEKPLLFSFVRTLIADFNVEYSYSQLMAKNVMDKVILRDAQPTALRTAIKPKEVKALIFEMFDDLATRGLIDDPDFSKASLQVQQDPINKNRLNVFFRYKRTGTVHILSTDVEAGY